MTAGRLLYETVRQDENVSQRDNADSDQYKDQHGPADLGRDLDPAWLPVRANSLARQNLCLR
jgi:hypothetical protein